MDLAVPIALTLALIVGLLWEHDGQMEVEEAEWDRFFKGRRLRFEATKEKLESELGVALEQAKVQASAVEFLRLQKQGMQHNLTTLEEALEEAKKDIAQVSVETTARDRKLAQVEKELFDCDEGHNQTMAKLDALTKEASSLHKELNALEKKKQDLTEKLNLWGARAGKKADGLGLTPAPTTAISATDAEVKKEKPTTASPDEEAEELTRAPRNAKNEAKKQLEDPDDDGAHLDAGKKKVTPDEIEHAATEAKAKWEKENIISEDEGEPAAHEKKNINKRPVVEADEEKKAKDDAVPSDPEADY